MSPLIAGDPVIDDQHPVQILVVDPSGGADLVTAATGTVGEYFQITACNSLAQASDHLRTQSYDAIVLEPNLPDSWPADSYRRLSEVADGGTFPDPHTRAGPRVSGTGFAASVRCAGEGQSRARHDPTAADQCSAAQESAHRGRGPGAQPGRDG